NTGGNMWPMLAGVGPILGDGSVGSFVANDGNVSWFYQDGKTGTRNPAGLETVSLTLQEEPALQTPSVAPVAVLVDSSTASSAEAITIAFHGRPASRSFGTRTAGKSTAVQPFKLDDGAELFLTTAIDADRSSSGCCADSGERPGSSCRCADSGERSGSSCRCADSGDRSGDGGADPGKCSGGGPRGSPSYDANGSGCRNACSTGSSCRDPCS